MSDFNAGTLENIAIQVARFFDPLRLALKSKQVIALYEELGVRFPGELETNAQYTQVVSAAAAPLTALTTLTQALLDGAGDFQQAIELFEALADGLSGARSGLQGLATGLDQLAANNQLPGFSVAEVNAFTSNLPARLLDWTAVVSLEEALPALTALFDLFGVVDRTELQVGSTDPKYPQYTNRALHLGKLPPATLSPFGTLHELYGFGDADFDGAELFARLESVLSRAGIPAVNEPTATPPQLDMVFAALSVDDTASPPGLALALKTHFDQEFTAELPPVTLSATVALDVPLGAALTLSPNLAMGLRGPGLSTVQGELRLRAQMTNPEAPLVLVGRAEGSRLELGGFSTELGATLVWNAANAAASGDFSFAGELQRLRLLIQASGDDGFLSAIFPSGGVDSSFDIGFRLNQSGFALTGSASFEVVLPLNLDLGVASVDSVRIGVVVQGGEVSIPLGAVVRGHFGPVEVLVDGIGVAAAIGFPDSGGNLGPVQVDIAPKFPDGAGIRVDAGAVTGGGFLTFGDTRYSGAIELSVFGIAVKAFGLIDTRLPDGSPGFSFVIVIIAEFTPIQLGFGFTLLGVGGLVGINRSVNQQALTDAVRTGSLAHLLFPRNPVENAPAIINDLATVFPGTKGHQIFGPMAKLGWGTPTLITADLGVILEFPGPRLALLGVVRMRLPSPDLPLVSLQMAVAGLFDFPAGRFALDASLYDSYVVGYEVSGDMAFRLVLGDSSQFLLSVGGYNSGFHPPPEFPSLRRAAIDVGVNGNPSITIEGYFALTSNTAQIGAAAHLRAHGFGVHLRGDIGFDVLFTFSPFHFDASISASVHVDFHGFGLGVTLHGSLSGPNPWHFNGRACVEVAFWDACLPIDISFGDSTPASLPELDPWVGNSEQAGVDPRVLVLGLSTAIADPRNWSGEAPARGFSVVSLAAAASARTPIDPMGAASLRQKVCPLNQVLEKFGQYDPVGHKRFEITRIALNGRILDPAEFDESFEKFAPAQFMKLTTAEKLSMPSYDDMIAGVSIAPNRVKAGPAGNATLEYETVLLAADGERMEQGAPPFKLTDLQLQGLLAGSAVARAGVRRVGSQKYLRNGQPKLVKLAPAKFVVADACSLVPNTAITAAPVSRTQAALALHAHVSQNPADSARFTIVPGVAA